MSIVIVGNEVLTYSARIPNNVYIMLIPLMALDDAANIDGNCLSRNPSNAKSTKYPL